MNSFERGSIVQDDIRALRNCRIPRYKNNSRGGRSPILTLTNPALPNKEKKEKKTIEISRTLCLALNVLSNGLQAASPLADKTQVGVGKSLGSGGAATRNISGIWSSSRHQHFLYCLPICETTHMGNSPHSQLTQSHLFRRAFPGPNIRADASAHTLNSNQRSIPPCFRRLPLPLSGTDTSSETVV